MAALVFRQKAINDISDIWNYTVNMWSETQADQYYTLIQTACHEIAENPTIGKPYQNIDVALLGYKFGKHIIFYHQTSEKRIEIIRILHERMDLEHRIHE